MQEKDFMDLTIIATMNETRIPQCLNFLGQFYKTFLRHNIIKLECSSRANLFSLVSYFRVRLITIQMSHTKYWLQALPAHFRRRLKSLTRTKHSSLFCKMTQKSFIVITSCFPCLGFAFFLKTEKLYLNS
jgi:hypothetical protein